MQKQVVRFIEKFKDVFQRFLPALLCAYAAALILPMEFEDNFHNNLQLKITLILIFGLLVFTLTQLLCEHKGRKFRYLGHTLAILFLIVYYLTLIPKEFEESGLSWLVTYASLYLAGLSALLWFSFGLRSAENPLDFWYFAKQVMLNFLLATLFAAILFGGLIAAAFALDSLFGIELPDQTIFRFWSFTALVFAPTMFLAQFPKPEKRERNPGNHTPGNNDSGNRFIKIITLYVLTPLSLIYFLILFSYTGKIIALWQWPSNQVAWWIIGFLIVSLLTYLFWQPFLTSQTRRYLWIFWILFLLQTGILFYAAYQRIALYSWTEPRYMLVLLTLWLTGLGLYFLLIKQASIKMIFISFSILLPLSQLGPWSMGAVSKSAQTKRLQELLIRYDVAEKYAEQKPIKMLQDERTQLRSILHYLEKTHGKTALLTAIPFSIEETQYSDIISEFNIIKKDDQSTPKRYHLEAKKDTPRDIKGYDYLVSDLCMRDYCFEQSLEDTGFYIQKTPNSMVLSLYQKDVLLDSFDLEPVLEQLVRNQIKKLEYSNLAPETLSWRYQGNNLDIKIFFLQIDYYKMEKGPSINARFDLLLKQK